MVLGIDEGLGDGQGMVPTGWSRSPASRSSSEMSPRNWVLLTMGKCRTTASRINCMALTGRGRPPRGKDGFGDQIFASMVVPYFLVLFNRCSNQAKLLRGPNQRVSFVSSNSSADRTPFPEVHPVAQFFQQGCRRYLHIRAGLLTGAIAAGYNSRNSG